MCGCRCTAIFACMLAAATSTCVRLVSWWYLLLFVREKYKCCLVCVASCYLFIHQKSGKEKVEGGGRCRGSMRAGTISEGGESPSLVLVINDTKLLVPCV